MLRLESDRLFYEHLEDKHFPIFFRHEQDFEIMQYIRNVAYDEVSARRKFNEYLAYMQQFPELGVFAVFEKETKKQIGLTLLFHIEMKPEHGRYEVGYRFEKNSWGKGYATEVTHVMLQYGFNKLGLKEICGTTDPNNINSQKVLLKVGMTDMGITTEFRSGSRFFVLKRENYQPRG